MTSSVSYQRRRRAELFKDQNGACFWCDEPMILLEEYPPDGRLGPDVCTIDHLFDRCDPERTQVTHGIQRWVAACFQCNQDRGIETSNRIQESLNGRRVA